MFALKVARARTRFRWKLIQREIADGIEMAEHPGIVFRSGPRGVAPVWWSARSTPGSVESEAGHRSFEDNAAN